MKTLIIFLFLILSSTAISQNIDLSGFFTFGISRTDSKDDFYYRYRINNKLNFIDDTIVGLNFAGRINDYLSSTVQLLYKKKLGKTHFYPEIELAFLKYHIYRNLNFKFGKIKFPIWLISEYRNVGYLYPWHIPPEELYENNIPAEDLVGIQASYIFKLSKFEIELNAMIGQTPFKVYFYKDFYASSTNQVQDGYVIGEAIAKNINVNIIKENFKFKFAFTNGDGIKDEFVVIDAYSLQNGLNSTFKFDMSSKDITFDFYSFGIELDFDNFQILSELGKYYYSNFELKYLNAMTEYITFVYKINKLRPHLTFLYGERVVKDTSALVPSTDLPHETKVVSVTLGLNYLLSTNNIIKLQVKNIHRYGSSETGPLYSSSFRRKNPFNLFSISINTIF